MSHSDKKTHSKAQALLREHARSNKACLLRLLKDESNDFELMRAFLEQYVEYAAAAEKLK
jgi:hypothetical protein